MKSNEIDRLDADHPDNAPPKFILDRPNLGTAARLRCHRDGDEAACPVCHPQEAA